MKNSLFISTPQTKRSRVAGRGVEPVGNRYRKNQRKVSSKSLPRNFTHKMKRSGHVQKQTALLASSPFLAKIDHTALGNVYKDTQNLNCLPIVARLSPQNLNCLPVVGPLSPQNSTSLPVVARLSLQNLTRP